MKVNSQELHHVHLARKKFWCYWPKWSSTNSRAYHHSQTYIFTVCLLGFTELGASGVVITFLILKVRFPIS